jgi:hypothetical protein
MKLEHMALLGGLAYLALRGGKPPTDSGGVNMGAPSGVTGPLSSPTADVTSGAPSVNTDGELPMVGVNPAGYIVATHMYKGKTAISSEAHTYNLQKKYGTGVQITQLANPLEKKVTQSWKIDASQLAPGQVVRAGPFEVTRESGGGTYQYSKIASRSPTSKAEATSARAENLRDLIARGAKDPRTLSKKSRALLGM